MSQSLRPLWVSIGQCRRGFGQIAIRCWANSFRHHELKRNRVRMERRRATPQVRDMVNGQKPPSATRATIVAACFKLCTIAAKVPASPSLESSVLGSLAAPAFHLDSWSAENGTGYVVGGHDADILENKRLSILQWVIARANECTALHPAAAALYASEPHYYLGYPGLGICIYANDRDCMRQSLCGVRSTQTQMR